MKQYSKQILMTAFIGLGLFSSGIAQVENKMEDLKKSVDKIFVNQPLWSINSTIYEVNLRQYAKNSSFKTFEKEIPRLKSMGVDILWFMPIHPIGVKERKGTLGSYYAVKDYKAVSEEFGTMDDFKHMVNYAHSIGMHVIIDWVANHTSPDHKWTETNPDFYTKDSTGKFVPPVPDWSDVIDLNYDNKAMRTAMIDAMKFWLTETKIDGFRCDVAEMVPTDFWIETHKELVAVYPNLFMLAEGEKPDRRKLRCARTDPARPRGPRRSSGSPEYLQEEGRSDGYRGCPHRTTVHQAPADPAEHGSGLRSRSEALQARTLAT